MPMNTQGTCEGTFREHACEQASEHARAHASEHSGNMPVIIRGTFREYASEQSGNIQGTCQSTFREYSVDIGHAREHACLGAHDDAKIRGVVYFHGVQVCGPAA